MQSTKNQQKNQRPNANQTQTHQVEIHTNKQQ